MRALAVALRRLPAVARYAVLSTLVGLLSGLIRGNGDNDESIAVSILRAILAAIIDVVWFFATFLTLPVIVEEGLGTLAAIRRSL